MSVIGEAADGLEAVTFATDQRPDVVLMDIQMPRMNGVDATRRIIEASPDARILAITTFSSQQHVVSALRAGASGYLVKDTEPHDIVDAIRAVHEGESVISPQITRELIMSLRQTPGHELSAQPNDAAGLSDRELSIVRLIAQGMSNAEIAKYLFLSEPTIKSNLGRIMTKWGVRDRVQVLIRAVTTGLVDLQAVPSPNPRSR